MMEIRLWYPVVFTFEVTVQFGSNKGYHSSSPAEVVSFEAPVVVVAAEDDGAKLDPARKVVVYGGVEAQDTGSYTLRWDQVRCAVVHKHA